jgi:hypothetical protein
MKDRFHLEQYLKDSADSMSDAELLRAVLERILKQADLLLRDKERKQE